MRLVDYSDFVTVPLAIGLMAALSGAPSVHAAIVFVIGFVAWTLIEYWVHRAAHSNRFPAFRRYHITGHHQHPKNAAGGTVYSTAAVVALSVIGTVLPSLAPIVAGFLSAYLWFIILHFALHHDATPVPGGLRDAHETHHHAGPGRMFGVTTTFWDHVFRTA